MGDPARFVGITIDVSDLDRAEVFWGRLLGVTRQDRKFPYSWLGEVAAGVQLILQQVPEPKVAKNRMHLEVTSDDAAGLLARIEEWGGTRLADVDEDAYSLTVMADPDGNEFCVGRRLSPALGRRDEMP